MGCLRTSVHNLLCKNTHGDKSICAPYDHSSIDSNQRHTHKLSYYHLIMSVWWLLPYRIGFSCLVHSLLNRWHISDVVTESPTGRANSAIYVHDVNFKRTSILQLASGRGRARARERERQADWRILDLAASGLKDKRRGVAKRRPATSAFPLAIASLRSQSASRSSLPCHPQAHKQDTNSDTALQNQSTATAAAAGPTRWRSVASFLLALHAPPGIITSHRRQWSSPQRSVRSARATVPLADYAISKHRLSFTRYPLVPPFIFAQWELG